MQLLSLPGYRLRFAFSRAGTILKIILQIPKILLSIRREHRWLETTVKAYKIDAIISDNRYGLYHKRIPAVFITHQLRIKTPFGRVIENWMQYLNYRLIQRFTACWIPDYAGAVNLGGKLSHPCRMPSLPVTYLGRLTRFTAFGGPDGASLLIVLSGPEPQRTVFEDILLRQIALVRCPVVLVRGLPHASGVLSPISQNLVVHNHLPAAELQVAISAASVVVSRSGYSTVLDLVGRDKKCIFVPTPGQSEQEYLAGYLSSLGLCVSYRQDRFDLQMALKAVAEWGIQPFNAVETDFREVVDYFLGQNVEQNVEQNL